MSAAAVVGGDGIRSADNECRRLFLLRLLACVVAVCVGSMLLLLLCVGCYMASMLCFLLFCFCCCCCCWWWCWCFNDIFYIHYHASKVSQKWLLVSLSVKTNDKLHLTKLTEFFDTILVFVISTNWGGGEGRNIRKFSFFSLPWRSHEYFET